VNVRWFRPAPPILRAAVALRPARPTLEQRWNEVKAVLRRYRRLLTAGVVLLAAVVALGRLAPKPPPTTAVVAATRDLPAGEVLTTGDLRMVALPPATVPAGAAIDVADLVGEQLSGPLRRGEVLTDVRLDDGPLARPAPGLVSAPVRFADSQAAELLRAGQHIDVLAASTAVDAGAAAAGLVGGSARGGGIGSGSGEGAVVVAADVLVVAIPARPSAGPAAVNDVGVGVGVEGALVVLATTADQARDLAQAEVSARLSAVVVG
jgi:pilus assembly protein CpaB